MQANFVIIFITDNIKGVKSSGWPALPQSLGDVMKLTKAEYDALPEGMKALFVADGDGYKATFMTVEEVQAEIKGLKDNNAKLVGEKKAEAERRAEAERLAKEKEEAAARKNGDLEAIDKSWQDKFTKYDADTKGKIEAYRKQIHDLTIGSAAKDLASKLFGKNAGIMQRHVMDRLALEEGEDGSLKVRVLQDGKPSALTMEELEKEFRSNEDFASVLAGTPAGGAPIKPTHVIDDPKSKIQMGHSFGITDLTKQASDIIAKLGDDE